MKQRTKSILAGLGGYLVQSLVDAGFQFAAAKLSPTRAIPAMLNTSTAHLATSGVLVAPVITHLAKTETGQAFGAGMALSAAVGVAYDEYLRVKWGPALLPPGKP